MPKVLFIGGTGLISSECASLALRSGVELFLLTRGKRPLELPPNTPAPQFITADIADEAAVARAIGTRSFDAVVNFIAYKPEHIERDVRLFAPRAGQYVFISSASVYQKPPTSYLITEGTPLSNPFWQYARDKIACEAALAVAAARDPHFAFTIVRPSLTYGKSRIPAAYHNSSMSWTTAQRLLSGKPVIVHGDGSSLWQITHAADFARGLLGLLANPLARGHAFHITTDEVLTWNQILSTLAATLGVKPNLVHVPSAFIAHFDPDRGPGLLGDKMHSVVLDNSKIKQFVPGYQAAIPFHVGLAETIKWFEADASRRVIDEKIDALTDVILAAYRRGLA